MLTRMVLPLIAGLLAFPLVGQAEHRHLNDATEAYEEAVEDLYDAARHSRVDAYTLRLLVSLERLADDLEDATERNQDPGRVHGRFQEIVSIHNRVHELLANNPYRTHDRRLSRALADEEVAMQRLSGLFVIQTPVVPGHSSYSPVYPPTYGNRGTYYPPSGRQYGPATRSYRFQVTPRLSLQFNSGGSAARGFGYRGGIGRPLLDDDDYEDYLEDREDYLEELEERREEIRERQEERWEEERERREEAWEEYQERLEDAREEGRGRGRWLRRF